MRPLQGTLPCRGPRPKPACSLRRIRRHPRDPLLPVEPLHEATARRDGGTVPQDGRWTNALRAEPHLVPGAAIDLRREVLQPRRGPCCGCSRRETNRDVRSPETLPARLVHEPVTQTAEIPLPDVPGTDDRDLPTVHRNHGRTVRDHGRAVPHLMTVPKRRTLTRSTTAATSPIPPRHSRSRREPVRPPPYRRTVRQPRPHPVRPPRPQMLPARERRPLPHHHRPVLRQTEFPTAARARARPLPGGHPLRPPRWDWGCVPCRTEFRTVPIRGLPKDRVRTWDSGACSYETCSDLAWKLQVVDLRPSRGKCSRIRRFEPVYPGVQMTGRGASVRGRLRAFSRT